MPSDCTAGVSQAATVNVWLRQRRRHTDANDILFNNAGIMHPDDGDQSQVFFRMQVRYCVLPRAVVGVAINTAAFVAQAALSLSSARSFKVAGATFSVAGGITAAYVTPE